MILFLSHTLGTTVPGYGSERLELDVRPLKSFQAGDVARTFEFTMENHWGTHVDCPAHFFDGGLGVVDYEADDWMFSSPQVLDVEAKLGELLGDEGLLDRVNADCDILLLRSGWSQRRGSREYSLENPGLTPAFCAGLRRERPVVRIVGFDWVSVSSFSHRETGREAHRALLDPTGLGESIRILEDLWLPEGPLVLEQVWVAPLRLEVLDSAPCTVTAVVSS